MVQYFDNGEIACYNGNSFRLDKKTGYYLSSKPIGKRRKRLHICVWESIYGEIPKGYHIHHADYDKSNNEISNLVLLTAHEHLKLHGESWTDERKQQAAAILLEKAIPKAVEWHKSEVGREWHAEHAKKQAQEWKFRSFICTYCGKEFESRQIRTDRPNNFCSNNCKSAYRRKMGFDDIIKVCKVCGKEYYGNKYQNTSRCADCKNCKRRA